MNTHPTLTGIHHVTAITSDAMTNIAFYSGLLGLRLVKVTVNFDDPNTYHLYYGNTTGQPGTIMTFFVWPHAHSGRQGHSLINTTSFSIPQSSLGFWLGRFIEQRIDHQGPITRFGEKILTLRDPDGLQLELVAQPNLQERPTWHTHDIPAEHAIRGLSGITIWEDDVTPSANFFTDTLNFRAVATEENHTRYELANGGPGTRIDLRNAHGFWKGDVAVGTVHHVAWRVTTDNGQEHWHDTLAQLGLPVTPVLDRQYFHSIYFPEPGGVLFEIATDPPGFTVNESVAQLGTHLQLPPWLEPSRATITQSLPPIEYPKPITTPE